MFLTIEEIAKRRRTYDAAKGMGPTVSVSPTEILEYLDEIESRDREIDDLKKELFEVRHTSGQRLDKTLSSIEETLKTLNKFVDKQKGDHL